MVTSNPVITMYGSGACVRMKRVIDAAVSACKEKTHRYDLSVIIEYRRKLLKMIISKNTQINQFLPYTHLKGTTETHGCVHTAETIYLAIHNIRYSDSPSAHLCLLPLLSGNVLPSQGAM